MPTYEYKCTVCDGRFDVQQKFTDDPLTTLPGCTVDGGDKCQLKKVFSAVGISFKGDGFYRNDSRSKSSSSSTSSSSGESSGGGSSEGSSSSSSDSGSSSSGSSDSGSSSSSSSGGGGSTSSSSGSSD